LPQSLVIYAIGAYDAVLVITLEKDTRGRLSNLAQLIVRHWLAILIVLTILFIVPIAAYPVMMATGNGTLMSVAGAVFTGYKPTCHQLPQRSLFLFGYQMTVCARDVGIYLSFLAGCVLFAFVRKKLKIWRLRWLILLCIPMAIDGFAQLFGVPLPRGIGPEWQLVRTVESTNLFRVVTGSIFGMASALYVLPYLEAIFAGVSVQSPAKETQLS
jgi:uncharacterized membrane protein